MPKKILITGASGFIGSFLVEEALHRGLQVYAGVRRTSNLQFLREQDIHVMRLNLSSEQELTATFNHLKITGGNLDYVIHNAGVTQAQTSEEFYEVNYRFTKNLVNALIASGMTVSKFVLVSTLATYGPGNARTFSPIQLHDKEKPLSTYALSKQMADQLVRSVKAFPCLILKPTAVYGPRDRDFLRLFKLIDKGYAFSIGSHRQMVSLLYVKDFARAALMSLKTPGGRTVLISDGANYTKDELNEAIRQALNRKVFRLTIPLRLMRAIVKTSEVVAALGGRRPFLNSEKLKEISAANWLCDGASVWQELHSEPQYNLREGIAETLQWFKEHQWLRGV